MKRTRALLIAASALLAACSTSYSITEGELEGYLNKQLRQQHVSEGNKDLGVDLVLGDTEVNIGDEADTVSVTSSARLKLNTPIIPLRAGISLSFKARPYYDPVEQAIYLKDVELADISASPSQVESILKPIGMQTGEWVGAILQNQPIYSLDNTDWRQELIGKFGRELKVSPGKLEFVLQP
ncbi:DUF1439 domain-containing protein [Ferrimonas lipolytica]|uniref:DUF1439 domain-containing protein n=1 Tax=Ferrimonas lipolytica TaxID=2724191 RepID=A0A6H1UJU9_9GAMM|nr:DUF1439 domain-containing protein [Ferrimonas lipolytica]QIZ78496.1 DUF1439 domain-containing protein [Ferrimonas lipolytica]